MIDQYKRTAICASLLSISTLTSCIGHKINAEQSNSHDPNAPLCELISQLRRCPDIQENKQLAGIVQCWDNSINPNADCLGSTILQTLVLSPATPWENYSLWIDLGARPYKRAHSGAYIGHSPLYLAVIFENTTAIDRFLIDAPPETQGELQEFKRVQSLAEMIGYEFVDPSKGRVLPALPLPSQDTESAIPERVNKNDQPLNLDN